MTDIASSQDELNPEPPKKVPSLRSTTRPTPRRVPTANRVTIAIPKPTPANDLTSARSTSSAANRSPDLNVTSTPWAKKFILTLDGGGIRGYSSLIILQALMKEIARIEQEYSEHATSSAHTSRIPRDQIPDAIYRNEQYLPCHYFDYIAGTSVGGLIAIMLGMLGKSVDDCINEFHRQNKAIPLADDLVGIPAIEFPLLYRRSTWPTKRTRSFFDVFAKFSVTATARNITSAGTTASATAVASSTTPTTAATASSRASSVASTESTEFRKDVYQCQTLAWCTEVERHQPRRPYAFCTYKEEEIVEGGPSASLVSIPEVAKAITTPSSYSFKPFKLGSGQFVDGSKQIRDPTLEVLKEITSLLNDGEPAINLLLSLGTDEHQAWFYEKLRTFTSSSSPLKEKEREDSLHREEGKSYKTYHRFEVPNMKLGFRKKYFLEEIEMATGKWLETEEQKMQISRYARMLVDCRRARAETVRWETFALGVRYVCHYQSCEGPESIFEGRGHFYDHLDRRHDLARAAAKGLVDVEKELDKGRQFGFS